MGCVCVCARARMRACVRACVCLSQGQLIFIHINVFPQCRFPGERIGSDDPSEEALWQHIHKYLRHDVWRHIHRNGTRHALWRQHSKHWRSFLVTTFSRKHVTRHVVTSPLTCVTSPDASRLGFVNVTMLRVSRLNVCCCYICTFWLARSIFTCAHHSNMPLHSDCLVH